MPSGNYQAPYQVDGQWHTAPTTFRTKGLADGFLSATRTDLERGAWIDPAAGEILLSDYAERWLADRPNLRRAPKPAILYPLRLHVLPTLGVTGLVVG